MVGPYASEQEVEELRHELGLDRPLPVQYVHWMGRAITGDLGRSIQGNADVLELILDRLPATLMLTAAALAITVAVALPLGIFIALNRHKASAQASNILVLILVSSPTFWLVWS